MLCSLPAFLACDEDAAADEPLTDGADPADWRSQPQRTYVRWLESDAAACAQFADWLAGGAAPGSDQAGASDQAGPTIDATPREADQEAGSGVAAAAAAAEAEEEEEEQGAGVSAGAPVADGPSSLLTGGTGGTTASPSLACRSSSRRRLQAQPAPVPGPSSRAAAAAPWAHEWARDHPHPSQLCELDGFRLAVTGSQLRHLSDQLQLQVPAALVLHALAAYMAAEEAVMAAHCGLASCCYPVDQPRLAEQFAWPASLLEPLLCVEQAALGQQMLAWQLPAGGSASSSRPSKRPQQRQGQQQRGQQPEPRQLLTIAWPLQLSSEPQHDTLLLALPAGVQAAWQLPAAAAGGAAGAGTAGSRKGKRKAGAGGRQAWLSVYAAAVWQYQPGRTGHRAFLATSWVGLWPLFLLAAVREVGPAHMQQQAQASLDARLLLLWRDLQARLSGYSFPGPGSPLEQALLAPDAAAARAGCSAGAGAGAAGGAVAAALFQLLHPVYFSAGDRSQPRSPWDLARDGSLWFAGAYASLGEAVAQVQVEDAALEAAIAALADPSERPLARQLLQASGRLAAAQPSSSGGRAGSSGKPPGSSGKPPGSSGNHAPQLKQRAAGGSSKAKPSQVKTKAKAQPGGGGGGWGRSMWPGAKR